MSLISLANSVMKAITFYADTPADWESDPKFAWINQLIGAVTTVLVPILIVVGAAGALYAVVLGINMARADSTEKREETKKRLVALIIGIAICLALVLFFLTLFPMIVKSFVPNEMTT